MGRAKIIEQEDMYCPEGQHVILKIWNGKVRRKCPIHHVKLEKIEHEKIVYENSR